MSAATITTTDGSFSYQLTDADLDWAARMIANEGGNQTADLWTMAQRFVLLHRSFPTFTAMLRAFSQPINPRWLATGDFCAPGGHYYSTPMCSADKLAKRAHAQDPQTSYPTARALVDAWATGHVPNPVPRATDFRAHDATAEALVRSGRMELVLDSGNWYFSTPDTQSWPAQHVAVGGSSALASSAGAHVAAFVGVALVLGLALAGAAWWESRR